MPDYLDDLFPCRIAGAPVMIDRRHLICIRPNKGPPYAGAPASLAAVLVTTKGEVMTDTAFSIITASTVPFIDIGDDVLVPVANITHITPVIDAGPSTRAQINTRPSAIFFSRLCPYDLFSAMEKSALKAQELKSATPREEDLSRRHLLNTPIEPP